jgi:hypothetical protein
VRSAASPAIRWQSVLKIDLCRNCLSREFRCVEKKRPNFLGVIQIRHRKLDLRKSDRITVSHDGKTATVADAQKTLEWTEDELRAAIADAQKRQLVDYTPGDPLIRLSAAGQAALKKRPAQE